MKSTNGEHYRALDHVRALAAFMVFSWHFLHATNGYPVPFGFAPSVFPLALLDEGHTGVALFMTLSGYLFAKLIANRKIHFGAFLWNRFIRLMPLLILVILINALILWWKNIPLQPFLFSVIQGTILPTLPNGGWSITAELHFYFLLPILFWLKRHSSWLVLGMIFLFIFTRAFLHHKFGEVQYLAYFTMIGRFDQFTAGILAWHWRIEITKQYKNIFALIILFFLSYFIFDQQRMLTYRSTSHIWIILPTLEGFVYALAIAWYDTQYKNSNNLISIFTGKLGTYSYSIYLLHLFFALDLANWIHINVMDISNFYIAITWSFFIYLALFPLGYLSFRFIENPWLQFRRKYIINHAI